MVFDALAVADEFPARVNVVDQPGRAGFDGRQKGFDQPALADARLAADENELALAGRGALVRVHQQRAFDRAADERIGGRERGRRAGCVRIGRHLVAGDFGDEPVADAVRGGDETRLARVVAECASQVAQARRDRALADHYAGPDFGEHLVLGDDLARPAGEHPQQGERLARQLDHATGREQRPVRARQAELAEAELARDRCGRFPARGVQHVHFPTVMRVSVPECAQVWPRRLHRKRRSCSRPAERPDLRFGHAFLTSLPPPRRPSRAGRVRPAPWMTHPRRDFFPKLRFLAKTLPQSAVRAYFHRIALRKNTAAGTAMSCCGLIERSLAR